MMHLGGFEQELETLVFLSFSAVQKKFRDGLEDFTGRALSLALTCPRMAMYEGHETAMRGLP